MLLNILFWINYFAIVYFLFVLARKFVRKKVYLWPFRLLYKILFGLWRLLVVLYGYLVKLVNFCRDLDKKVYNAFKYGSSIIVFVWIVIASAQWKVQKKFFIYMMNDLNVFLEGELYELMYYLKRFLMYPFTGRWTVFRVLKYFFFWITGAVLVYYSIVWFVYLVYFCIKAFFVFVDIFISFFLTCYRSVYLYDFDLKYVNKPDFEKKYMIPGGMVYFHRDMMLFHLEYAIGIDEINYAIECYFWFKELILKRVIQGSWDKWCNFKDFITGPRVVLWLIRIIWNYFWWGFVDKYLRIIVHFFLFRLPYRLLWYFYRTRRFYYGVVRYLDDTFYRFYYDYLVRGYFLYYFYRLYNFLLYDTFENCMVAWIRYIYYSILLGLCFFFFYKVPLFFSIQYYKWKLSGAELVYHWWFMLLEYGLPIFYFWCLFFFNFFVLGFFVYSACLVYDFSFLFDYVEIGCGIVVEYLKYFFDFVLNLLLNFFFNFFLKYSLWLFIIVFISLCFPLTLGWPFLKLWSLLVFVFKGLVNLLKKVR